jgi:hypothetical protein
LVKGKLEFFRGDGWQLLLACPAMALLIKNRREANGLVQSKEHCLLIMLYTEIAGRPSLASDRSGLRAAQAGVAQLLPAD